MKERIKNRLRQDEKNRMLELARENNDTLAELIRLSFKHKITISLGPDGLGELILMSKKAGLPVSDLKMAAFLLRRQTERLGD